MITYSFSLFLATLLILGGTGVAALIIYRGLFNPLTLANPAFSKNIGFFTAHISLCIWVTFVSGPAAINNLDSTMYWGGVSSLWVTSLIFTLIHNRNTETFGKVIGTMVVVRNVMEASIFISMYSIGASWATLAWIHAWIWFYRLVDVLPRSVLKGYPTANLVTILSIYVAWGYTSYQDPMYYINNLSIKINPRPSILIALTIINVLLGIFGLWGKYKASILLWTDTRWENMPVYPAILVLSIMRERLRESNLIHRLGPNAFGRNMPQETRTFTKDPNPKEVAEQLFKREGDMITNGDQFNLLAAAWIQFMVHDWMEHKTDSKGSTCMRNGTTFNTRTSFWDGSMIYGNTPEELRLKEDGIHLKDDSGDLSNLWVGMSFLRRLFIKEHNYIVDKIKTNHPEMNDDEAFSSARLTVAATIAKIHTVDWTIQLLDTPILYSVMKAQWYGLLGKRIKGYIGHTGWDVTSGIPGFSSPVTHNVPFSMTEEFTSVYRMHSLIPDDIKERLHQKGENELKDDMKDIAEELRSSTSGALVLHNTPKFMFNIQTTKIDGTNGKNINLVAKDIERDRTHNVARYNAFRKNLYRAPATWDDFDVSPETLAIIKELYNDDIDTVDLQVGLYAEKKMPGFAISTTAFYIFIVMAARRVESDPNFTSRFTEEFYSSTGIKHISDTESINDILARHCGTTSEDGVSGFSVYKQ